ncbi:MAG TPA: hypothetical protein VIF62_22900 [Labilithrix sp.]|jgi:hypothetical protein
MKLSPVLGLLAMTVVACGAQKPPATPGQTTLTNAMIPDPDTSSTLVLDTVDPWEEEAVAAPVRTWATPSNEQGKLPQLDAYGNPMHL